MIDTHSHLYSEEFDIDSVEAIHRAKEIGVTKIILPNIDSDSLPHMLKLEAEYPGYCFAAIGLHPTSVKSDFRTELDLVESELKRREYIAIGEIGIDLYWDKSFLQEQLAAFRQQLDWAIEYKLPVIIHVRDSMQETIEVMESYRYKGLKGVFHSFTGSKKDADWIIDFGGFYLGINGIITFKNSGLDKIIRQLSIENLLLETDSPYLTPVPYRGKRNESAYIDFVCQKLSDIFEVEKSEIIQKTTKNSLNLFKKLNEISQKS